MKYQEIKHNEMTSEMLEQLRIGAFFTTKVKDKVNTMTIGWGGINIVWNKPLFVAYVRLSRDSYDMVEKSSEFTISVPIKKDMKIFVQIASYRDPELIKTIKDMIQNAKRPKNLVIGICRQYHPEDGFDNLDEFKNDKRIKSIDVLYSESKGVCWARNQVQQLYNGEEYTLWKWGRRL